MKLGTGRWKYCCPDLLTKRDKPKTGLLGSQLTKTAMSM